MYFRKQICFWLYFFISISKVNRISGALQCTTARLDDLKQEILRGQKISSEIIEELRKPGEGIQNEFKLELKSFQAEVKWIRNEFLWLHNQLGEMHQLLTDVKNVVKRKIRNDTKFIREQVVNLNDAIFKTEETNGFSGGANSTIN